uniref:Membrane lipoprotein n=1 Tax=Davidia involucrata TaxID=16924 RepID=A0A5B6YV03_DAVIN
MRSLSGVGLGLSLVFGCLLLALIAELYYLLWWKKRITNREIEEDYISPAREFLYMFCWKKPSSLSSTALNPQELCSSSVRITDTHVHEPQAQLHMHSNKDLWLKPFGDQDGEDSEFMRLSGPPRFLFTIKEETKEDLESADGKSRKGSRSRSLSDVILTVETPFLTPLASPPYFTPPLTPMDSSYHQNGFNPLFESSTDAEFNRIKSSPPPKFKFLKDAEDKLYRRKLMEEAKSNSMFLKDEENESFITLIVANNSTSSQVLPLPSSPSTFRPPANKKTIFH